MDAGLARGRALAHAARPAVTSASIRRPAAENSVATRIRAAIACLAGRSRGENSRKYLLTRFPVHAIVSSLGGNDAVLNEQTNIMSTLKHLKNQLAGIARERENERRVEAQRQEQFRREHPVTSGAIPLVDYVAPKGTYNHGKGVPSWE